MMNKIMKGIIIVGVAVILFMCGAIFGVDCAVKEMNKQFEELQPMIENDIQSEEFELGLRLMKLDEETEREVLNLYCELRWDAEQELGRELSETEANVYLRQALNTLE